MMTEKLILASSSASRYKLLQRLQYPFEICVPDVDETPLPAENPQEMVQRLALAKAQKAAETHKNHIIIGSDQVGVVHNQILGKPMTLDNARKQLKQISGQYCYFYNGLCVLNSAKQSQEVILETVAVHFKELSEDTIERYLAKENPLACAGSIKIEGLAIALIDKLECEDPASLEGLPLMRLVRMLKNAGIEVV